MNFTYLFLALCAIVGILEGLYKEKLIKHQNQPEGKPKKPVLPESITPQPNVAPSSERATT